MVPFHDCTGDNRCGRKACDVCYEQLAPRMTTNPELEAVAEAIMLSEADYFARNYDKIHAAESDKKAFIAHEKAMVARMAQAAISATLQGERVMGLVSAVENVCIADDMAWDMEGVITVLRKALSDMEGV